MATSHDQYKWRTSGVTKVDGKPAARVGVAVTVFLNEQETAILDGIAIEMYRNNPHDPRLGEEGESRVFPGRAGAIRLLIDGAGPSSSAQVRWIQGLRKLRGKLGEFWIAEAAWRQVRHNSRKVATAIKPIPPWKGR